MPQNVYVMQEKTNERDSLNVGMYFTSCDEPHEKKHSVIVERSESGIYDLPSGQESYSEALSETIRESKACYLDKRKKLFLLGSIFVMICIISFVIIHASSNNIEGEFI